MGTLGVKSEDTPSSGTKAAWACTTSVSIRVYPGLDRMTPAERSAGSAEAAGHGRSSRCVQKRNGIVTSTGTGSLPRSAGSKVQ